MATPSLAEQVERRRKAQLVPAQTCIEDLLDANDESLRASRLSAWPDRRWEKDIVGFATIILGVELWARQVEIVEAIVDERHVAIMGGRKVGKDFLVAVLALWWYATYDDARVFMLAVTADQIQDVLWREIRKLHHGSGRCVACKKSDPRGPTPCPHSTPLDGVLNEKADTGLKASKSGDLREIVGMTARAAEGAAGVSGTRVLYVQDEASGQSDETNRSILGNMASSACRRVILSNGTRNQGFFYDAFHEPADKRVHRLFQVSSLESPNIVQGREVFPGLADRVWLEEMKRIWGEDSAEYAVHVLGRFAENEEAKIVNLHQITLAKARWKETQPKLDDRLQIGIDVAGEGDKGDESIFVARRGLKMHSLIAFRGLTVEDHLAHAIGIVGGLRRAREGVPLICVDREGPIGYRVWVALDAYADKHPEAFAVAGVRASSGAIHERENYATRRDELWGNAANWIRHGGTLIEDAKLEAELHTPEWIRDHRGRRKVTDKKILKKKLKRSPDRAEAFCLSVWDPADFELGGKDSAAGHERGGATLSEGQTSGMDAYELEGTSDGADPIYGVGADKDPIYGR